MMKKMIEKFKNVLSKEVKLFLLAWSASPVLAFAGQGNMSISDITSKVTEATNMGRDIAVAVIGVALLVGLITVVYKVVTNDPHSKEFIIGFIVAVVVVGIAYSLLGVN